MSETSKINPREQARRRSVWALKRAQRLLPKTNLHPSIVVHADIMLKALITHLDLTVNTDMKTAYKKKPGPKPR